MLHPRARVAAGGHEDVALGDDLQPVAQARAAQRGAEQLLDPVAAIDVGMVHRGDALLETGLDLGTHMTGRGVRSVGETPEPIDDAAELEPLGDLHPVHEARLSLHQRRSPAPRGVLGVSDGTRP